MALELKHIEHMPDGIWEEWYLDEDEDVLHIKTCQDVEPFLDHCANLRSGNTRGFSKSGDLKTLSSIPLSLYAEWIKTYGLPAMTHDHELLKRLIRDAAYSKFRTSAGAI